ncbi:MAG: lipid-A-disaccharide synthase [Paludibacteraceae bacterium]|nr:lipid-A-disaccharide synthase [Paludibacteraceae bacterium]
MKYFLIAGEASGDLHASNLMYELKKEDPAADFCFLGGDLMAAQGGIRVKHYRDMAFMGFVAVLRNLKTVLKNIDDCKMAIAEFKPDAVILIDYPSFNLRIAKYVKQTSETPVYYYIAPKLWAWKEYRIKSIKKYVDKVFTIFPFETDFYRKHNYKVEYVGNPTMDSVNALCRRDENASEFCKRHTLSEKPIIALLPGSRRQEIYACLPTMIEAAESFPEYQIVISGAPGIEAEYYQQFSNTSNHPVIIDDTYQILVHAKAAIVNSGTATLETALIGTPQLVVYHVMGGRLAILGKNIFIKTKYISLVNIVAQREVVRELIAHLFTVQNVSIELRNILTMPDYALQMKKDYIEIAENLGQNHAAVNAAMKIINHLITYKK